MAYIFRSGLLMRESRLIGRECMPNVQAFGVLRDTALLIPDAGSKILVGDLQNLRSNFFLPSPSVCTTYPGLR